MKRNWLLNLKRENGKTNLLSVVLLSYLLSIDDYSVMIERKHLADLLGYQKRMISRGLRFLEGRALIERKVTRYPYLAIYIDDEEIEIVQITEENTIEDIGKYYRQKYEGEKFETKITYRSKLIIFLNQENIEKIS